MAKILVVEDEADLRELIVEQLEDEGHQTFEAVHGEDGLKRLGEVTPDLILSDITMPVMNGYHFFRSLKENHPEHANTPFLFLTALSSKEDELKGLRLGADGYITKPIDFDLLMARVDGILRIFRLQKTLEQMDSSAPLQTPSSHDASAHPITPAPVDRCQDPTEIRPNDKIRAIAHRDGRPIVAGKFQTVSLDKIRRRIGEKWQDVADKILRNAEQVIRRHLTDKDVLCKYAEQDFAVCFAELDSDQAAVKVEVICDEIWERLFGETQDGCLSNVDGKAYDLFLSTEMVDQDSDLLSEIGGLIQHHDRKSINTALRRIEQIYRYEDFKVIRLLGGGGLPSKINKVSFNKRFMDKLAHAFAVKRFPEQALINLQDLFFEKLRQKITQSDVISKSATIINADFAMMSHAKARKSFTIHCQRLQEKMEGVLIVEVTGTPERFASHIDELEPLPVARRLQALELSKPKQLQNLDLKQLHCAIISMAYAHALDVELDELQLVKKDLKRYNIKFYIKDVPEGAMIEAQRLKADLYSIQ